MTLIVISDPEPLNNEIKIFNQLFEAGLEILHLRKPGIARTGYQALLTGIDQQFHKQVALHQFHDLKQEFDIRRLHFSEYDRKYTSLPGFNDKNVYSTSTHKLDCAGLNDFNYTFFGPVFNSISKPGYQGVADENFKLPFSCFNLPVIAIGGIEIQNIAVLNKMGFDGAAVLGAIWSNPPAALAIFKELKAKCR